MLKIYPVETTIIITVITRYSIKAVNTLYALTAFSFNI